MGLIASAVPRPLSLTILRIVVPASLPLAVLTVARTDPDPEAVAALVLALLTTALALTADVGNLFADGSSYGPERRMLLRPPAAVALLVVPVSWALVVF